MALEKKPIKGSGAIKRRDVVSSNDGTTVQRTETWVGAYAELAVKQEAVYLSAKSTTLTPTEAGEGELKIAYELQLTAELETRPPSVETVEVLWQELRLPVETNPAFAALSAETIHAIRQATEVPIDEATLPPEAGVAGGELYDLLRKGTTEWVTYVPLVRRTTTNVLGNVGSGSAGHRDAPPVSVAGDWEFLKTADERRQVGRRFDQVEEWTGAEVWDPILYP